jgi:hypothetical protein
MFYGYVLLFIIIINNNFYYNQLKNEVIITKNQLKTKINIINNLNIELEHTKRINNILKLQLKQEQENRLLPNNFINLKK